MKDKDYSSHVFLNNDFTVKDATCNCARGVYCHHIAALLICAHYNISVTDIECTWKSKHQGGDRNDGKSFKELFPQAKCFSAMGELSESEVKEICDNIPLCGRGCAGIRWIVKEEPQSCNEIDNPSPSIPNIRRIINSAEYLSHDNKFGFLLSKLRMLPNDIVSIANATVGQIHNPLWCEARECRFSGSILGSVIKTVSKKRKLAPSLLQTISSQAMLKPVTVGKVKKGVYSERINPRQWGDDHEAEAKKKFSEVTGLEVQETGLWIHESGFWCASPDGLVGDNAVLEVKCPFKFRAQESLKECLDEQIFFNTAPSKRYAVYYDSELGEFCMWKEHPYYHQIQSEIWCSYRELCYFVVWIPQDMAILTVERDEEWYEANIPKLESAYEKQFLPVLMK